MRLHPSATPPTTDSQPAHIATGPDGAVWFTESAGNKIGRITTAGTINEYALPTVVSGPFDITAGPDDNLWLTEDYVDKIAIVTP
ncbi:virginiamycin B lyase family protein [Streptosporangium sp. NBC_01810]|uniref:virginiamycin B lyase family protein n=1 Tax=Streptosporangium sp. NBC_01810 TaxID=2975951 RepID=UPI003FA39F01